MTTISRLKARYSALVVKLRDRVHGSPGRRSLQHSQARDPFREIRIRGFRAELSVHEPGAGTVVPQLGPRLNDACKTPCVMRGRQRTSRVERRRHIRTRIAIEVTFPFS